MAYNTFSSVQSIIDRVSQDVRLQLASTTNSVGQPILIDYTNRIHKQILRFSNWKFMDSPDLYFITHQGQTKYWLGPQTDRPVGCVDTGLHLTDMGRIKKDTVVDVSNSCVLGEQQSNPVGPQLTDRAAAGREGLPKSWIQDPNNPNILVIYPPPVNDNLYQPVPDVPYAVSVSSGSLPARTYYVKVTYVDSASGESTSTANGAEIYLPANTVLKVYSPSLVFNQSATGVTYNQYNVYVNETEGSETLQNVSPIAIGTDWQEPTTGLTSTGQAVPTTNTLMALNGYVIRFSYYKQRIELDSPQSIIQIPSDYDDIVIQGVNALGWKLIGNNQEAQSSFEIFKAGLTSMVWDKNQNPSGPAFMRPDPASRVNAQLMNMWPPSF